MDAGSRLDANLIVDGVDRPFVAVVRQRRHTSLELDSHDRFIKTSSGCAHRPSLEHERQVVSELRSLALLGNGLPLIHQASVEGDGVMFELLPGSDLRFLELDGLSDLGVARRLGELLRLLHGLKQERVSAISVPAEVVVNLQVPSIEDLGLLTPAGFQLLRIIQTADSLPTTLKRLAEGWQPACTIHGDLRFDNLIVTGDPTRPVVLVDWEYAGRGDRSWDVGSVLGELLSTWLYAGTRLDPTSPPVVVVRWAREFLSSYSDGRLDQTELRRAIEYAGVWLIQLAIEEALVATRLSPGALMRLQLAQNIFLRPAAAAQLIGVA